MPPPTIDWTDAEQSHRALWRSEANVAAPARVQVVDDTLTADKGYRLACEGTALLWRGDFQNARQLLVAMMHRIDRKPVKRRDKSSTRPQDASSQATSADAFHKHRLARSQRARILGSLLVPVAGDYGIPLRRAPDMRQALAEAWGPADAVDSVVSLRELLGLVGAHEWRKKGIAIAALGEGVDDRIHPHYGVFAPTRGEYIDLVVATPMPTTDLAFDIGVGTGVLTAVLIRRGVKRVVATDTDPRAITCARENLTRLGMANRVELLSCDMFPPGKAPWILCNPPWVPARASAPIERAIYDEDCRMLRAFLAGLSSHLTPGGEGWLVLSDIAEHFGLRTRQQLLNWIAEAGLAVIERRDIRPRHGKVSDASEALHAARAAEVTSLWRLAVVQAKGKDSKP